MITTRGLPLGGPGGLSSVIGGPRTLKVWMFRSRRSRTLESVPGSKVPIDREGWPEMPGCWRLTGRRDQQQYPLFSNWDEAAIINGC